LLEVIMRISSLAALAVASLALLPASLRAASLQVSPISIEVQAPAAAATIKLHNSGTEVLNAQIRVFRWTQVNGEEKFEPTNDVVASPPTVSLAPNTDYTVRLVRVTKQPVAQGETYRLFVDELPDNKAQQSRSVTLVMRYSIPVFFYSRDSAEAKLAWSIERRGGQVYVVATNAGDRHARLSSLKLRDANDTTASFGNGLAGYVLGHSTMRWQAPGNSSRLGAASPVVISALSDSGPINASTSAQSAR
jgi:fimbrial chaperone protein